jgi:hypothetical protein
MSKNNARVVDYYGDDLDRAVYSAVQHAIRENPPLFEAKPKEALLI